MVPTPTRPSGRIASAIGDLSALALGTALYGARATAFWAAIALPFVHVPLLYSGAPEGRTAVLAPLLVLNVVCLVVGQNHNGLS